MLPHVRGTCMCSCVSGCRIHWTTGGTGSSSGYRGWRSARRTDWWSPLNRRLVVICYARFNCTAGTGLTDELCWWKDLERSWPNTEHIEQCTRPTPSWLRAAAMRLEQHSDFDWNRRSESGRQRLDDTTSLLREALTELENKASPAEAG